MKASLRLLTLLLLILNIFIRCNTETSVFDNLISDLQGKWKIYDISGGFTGDGFSLNFEYLNIEGTTYSILNNDVILESGTIYYNGEEEISGDIDLKFAPLKINTSIFQFDPEKTANISNDTLNLYSPCCDRFNYHFTREN